MKLELKCLREISNSPETKLKDGIDGHRQVLAGHTHVKDSTWYPFGYEYQVLCKYDELFGPGDMLATFSVLFPQL